MTNSNTDPSKTAGEDKPSKINPIPKMPSLNFGSGKNTFLSGRKVSVQKPEFRGRFNQATFHTQHKGGSASGGK